MVSVSSFGFVTAGRYFVAGNVDFGIAILFVIGGIFGGYIGIKTSEKIPKENLVKIFSIMLFGNACNKNILAISKIHIIKSCPQ
jgi:uncharacterized membrane protein YfcA